MHPPENALVQKCLQGDARAQKEFYDLYSPAMNGVCYRYAKNAEDARDILQEGFIKVFLKLSTFKSEGPIEGWIRKIMVNTALDFIKMRNRHFFEEEDKIAKITQHSTPDVFNKLNSEDLVKCIMQLPEGYRAVFNMVAIEGYSHREAGELLNISESTSRSQFARARARLIQIIQQQFKTKEYEVV